MSVAALNRRLSLIENGKVAVNTTVVNEAQNFESPKGNDESLKKSTSPSVVKANLLSELRRAGERIAFAALTYSEIAISGATLEVIASSADSFRALREKEALISSVAKRFGVNSVGFSVKQKEDTSEEQKK